MLCDGDFFPWLRVYQVQRDDGGPGEGQQFAGERLELPHASLEVESSLGVYQGHRDGAVGCYVKFVHAVSFRTSFAGSILNLLGYQSQDVSWPARITKSLQKRKNTQSPHVQPSGSAIVVNVVLPLRHVRGLALGEWSRSCNPQWTQRLVLLGIGLSSCFSKGSAGANQRGFEV